MGFLACTILFIMVTLKLASLQFSPKNPECIDNAGFDIVRKRCCAHYRTIGLRCFPCIGSFGIECMQKCPDGFYGVQCAEVCSCTKCNKTTGDCFNKTMTSTEEPHRNSESQIISILSGVGLVLGAVSIIILFLFSYVTNSRCLDEKDSSLMTTSGLENFERTRQPKVSTAVGITFIFKQKLLTLLISQLIVKQTSCNEILPVEPLCQDIATTYKGKFRCCSSYRTIGEKCYPCFGSFGEECSRPCPEGYYGLKCSKRCPCGRCNATTGECFKVKGTSNSLLISLAIGSTVVVLSLALCAIFRHRKRNVSSLDIHGNYELQEKDSRDLYPSLYTKVDESSYQECDQISSNYLEVIHSSCRPPDEGKHRQHDKPEEGENTREPRQSILSFLIKKNKYSDNDKEMVDRAYIDVIEKEENTEESVTVDQLMPSQVVTIKAGPGNTKTTIARAFSETSKAAASEGKTTVNQVTKINETKSTKRSTTTSLKRLALALTKPSTTAKEATIFLKPMMAKTATEGVSKIHVDITTPGKYFTKAPTATTTTTENITTSPTYLTTAPIKTTTKTTTGNILSTATSLTNSIMISEKKATGDSSVSSVKRLIKVYESQGKD